MSFRSLPFRDRVKFCARARTFFAEKGARPLRTSTCYLSRGGREAGGVGEGGSSQTSLDPLNCRVQSKSEIFEDYGLMKFEPGGFARGVAPAANHRRSDYTRNRPFSLLSLSPLSPRWNFDLKTGTYRKRQIRRG